MKVKGVLSLYTSLLRLFFILGFLMVCGIKTSYEEEEISFGPLFDKRTDPVEGSDETSFLGPLITYKEKEGAREFGFRPLFYFAENEEEDTTEFDFLYPLMTYDRDKEDKRLQLLLYLFTYDIALSPGRKAEKEFTLFPLIFSKSAEKEEDSYFALFPFFGKIKDKFRRDEINFVLFPLYLETKQGEVRNYSFLWPLFGYYTGGGQKGFRFWPLFGYTKKEGEFESKFALWPIYISQRSKMEEVEEPSFPLFPSYYREFLLLFPFYQSFKSQGRTSTIYLWPLFSHVVDEKKKFERWDAPWPIISYERGEDRSLGRFFPLFMKRTTGTYESAFFLWPLYRFDKTLLGNSERTRRRFLYFLYSDIKEKATREGGRDSRRIDVWPLFTYKRDAEGNIGFHFLSILEPFLHENKGIERNYSPLWRLYQFRKESGGRKVSSFLWNIYRQESDKDYLKVGFRPIIPIFSYERNIEGSDFSVLGGLFGYKLKDDREFFKFFFIPIPISKEEKKSE